MATLTSRAWHFGLAQLCPPASVVRTRRTSGSDLSARARRSMWHKSLPGAGRSPSSNRSPSTFTWELLMVHIVDLYQVELLPARRDSTTHKHPVDETSSSRPRVQARAPHAPPFA